MSDRKLKSKIHQIDGLEKVLGNITNSITYDKVSHVDGVITLNKNDLGIYRFELLNDIEGLVFINVGDGNINLTNEDRVNLEKLEKGYYEVIFEDGGYVLCPKGGGGGGKLNQIVESVILDEDSTIVPLPDINYKRASDILQVFVGGIYQKEGMDYTMSIGDAALEFTKVKREGAVIDFVLLRNVLVPEDKSYDGAFMLNGSLTDDKLSEGANQIKARVSKLGSILEGDLSIERDGKDSEGIYTQINWLRPDGSLYRRSTLSGGTSPTYTTRTVTFYAADGETVVKTNVYELTYDDDDQVISEVLL